MTVAMGYSTMVVLVLSLYLDCLYLRSGYSTRTVNRNFDLILW